MFNEENFNSLHLSDLDILREADGELPSFRSRQVREHLAVCWTCRARRAEIEAAISDFVHVYHRQWEAAIPPRKGSDRLLKARLAEAHRETNPSIEQRRYFFHARVLVVAALAVLVFVLAFARWPLASLYRTGPVRSDALVPKIQITPGVVSPVTRDEVCRMESAAVGTISDSIARQVFVRYGLKHPAPGLYEIDYVVPPALGGSQTVENLWPQLYNRGEWNSHVKDALEERLESLVCSGQLEVQQAQNDLAQNWIAAYKTYFKSEKPLLEHLAFAKDQPWPSPGERPIRSLQ